jgi:cytoskeleton protein RodZ
MLTEQNNSLESNDLNQVEQETIPDFVPDKVQGNIAQVLDLLENDAPDVESELRLFDDDMSASNDVEIVELMFTFSNDCWIKITDATGNDIAYGVKKQGRVMPVSGQPPFSVILGAPASVKVKYAGTPVDISFLPSDRTGRFVLPLQE